MFEDECGGEFGAGCEASSKEQARRILDENYPESRIVQLESPQDSREREAAIYARVSTGMDDDEDFDDDYLAENCLN